MWHSHIIALAIF